MKREKLYKLSYIEVMVATTWQMCDSYNALVDAYNKLVDKIDELEEELREVKENDKNT